MLTERETGDLWDVIEQRKHLAVIKRQSDGLLRTVLADSSDYEQTPPMFVYIGLFESGDDESPTHQT